MKHPKTPKTILEELRSASRRAVSLTREETVTFDYPGSDLGLPLVIEARIKGLVLSTWASSRRELVEDHVLKYGAVLFRNFKVPTATELERFISSVSDQPFAYHDRWSPRSEVSGNIYSSAEYPADQTIFLHNENSYAHSWPLRIFFWCVTPAQRGGETPIADTWKILQRIEPRVRRGFMQERVLYVRNFGGGLGLHWQTAYQTSDRLVAEKHCRDSGYETRWEGERLTTRRVGPAFAIHPRTCESVWFNQATFFHVSTLDPAIRKALLQEVKQEDLPHNTYYGDGVAIEDSVLDHLREAYQRETVIFQWQAGDVLMLDNMLTAHGRMPFAGPRHVLVGMSEPCGVREFNGEGAAVTCRM
jgi:alpha-ketoglutarate-dependent taurine dioxygenase